MRGGARHHSRPRQSYWLALDLFHEFGCSFAAGAGRAGRGAGALAGRPVDLAVGHLGNSTWFGNFVEWPICHVGAGMPGAV